MDEHDKSTWTKEVTYLPALQEGFRVSEFAPKAWAAICEVLGGRERVCEGAEWWDDGFIVNLGRSLEDEDNGEDGVGRSWEEKIEGGAWGMTGRKLADADGWHVDGDFFVHYLDSPEQGLLVIPLFSDILEGAGGTVVAPDSIGKIARWLHDHPEGVTPNMIPFVGNPTADDFCWPRELTDPGDRYYEAAGEVGDVLILHPLTLHSAYQNFLRLPRLTTNHCVGLTAPFNFNRRNPADYSLVELKTLQDLGVNALPNWRVMGPRKTHNEAECEKIDQAWRDEVERLRAQRDEEQERKDNNTD